MSIFENQLSRTDRKMKKTTAIFENNSRLVFRILVDKKKLLNIDEKNINWKLKIFSLNLKSQFQ